MTCRTSKEPEGLAAGKTAADPLTNRPNAILATVPAILVAIRIALGPVLVFAALAHASPAWIIAILLAAMLSDIFDGVIARRLKIATERLRVADSWSDAWFFICVGAAAWLCARAVLQAYWFPLVAEVVLQLASYAYDLVRYRRIASLHAYSTKIWAFTLYLATCGVLAFHSGALIWLAFGMGLISAADALAIKLILPGWNHDVLSCIHAWRQVRTSERSR